VLVHEKTSADLSGQRSMPTAKANNSYRTRMGEALREVAGPPRPNPCVCP